MFPPPPVRAAGSGLANRDGIDALILAPMGRSTSGAERLPTRIVGQRCRHMFGRAWDANYGSIHRTKASVGLGFRVRRNTPNPSRLPPSLVLPSIV